MNRNRSIKKMMIVFVLLCIYGCSNNKQKNEIALLHEKGYEPTQSAYSNNVWKALYQKDNALEDSYVITASMDQKTYDKLYKKSIFNNGYKKSFYKIIESLSNCTIISLNDKLPDDSEFNKYIGKTISSLENDDYIRNGYVYNEYGVVFFLEGPLYNINVITTKQITSDLIDSYSDSEIRTLVIKSIELIGFSNRIFDLF